VDNSSNSEYEDEDFIHSWFIWVLQLVNINFKNSASSFDLIPVI